MRAVSTVRCRPTLLHAVIQGRSAVVREGRDRSPGCACQRLAKKNPSLPLPLAPLVLRHLCSGALLATPIDLVPNAGESNSAEVSVREGLLGMSEAKDQVCSSGIRRRHLRILPEGWQSMRLRRSA
jgi:hypothetical protein